jgi:RNA polymerase sigma-70 factor (ECF subfamily)
MTENPTNPMETTEPSEGKRAGVNASAKTGDASDHSLLELVRGRDQDAMAALFDRYGTMVYSIAMRVLKEPSSAEDVMQEVFIRVWENPEVFISERGSLAGWLAVVTRNRAVDALRRRRPSDSVNDVELPTNTNLASEAERNIMMQKVQHVLETLPADQRLSLELAFFDGLSHSEIAERTGAPLGTVKTRIRSALINLREAVTA